MMKKLVRYLNPIAHLGEKKYSVTLPILATIIFAVLLEYYANEIVHDPDIVGIYAIIIPVALIIFCAFRYGIPGGVVVVFFTIIYYGYIIMSRDNPPEERLTQWETTGVLGAVYLLMAVIIGWLKQKIDDLIEREANERRRLTAILQQLPLGVVITDSNGVVVQSNKQVEVILGVKISAGLLAGRDMVVKTSQNGKELQPAQSPLAKVINTGKPIVGKELDIERPDGRKVYIQVSATPIHNRKGKIIAAVSIFSDITAQKDLEKRKDDFVNMASHELKTPITSMMLYIDSLLLQIKKYRDTRADKTLNSIKYQTIRLKELVSDLLDVSRLQTGKMNFNIEEFKLDSLVEETVDQLRGSMKVNRKLIFKSKKPVKVNGDKFRIYQVLTNLITNADKYSPGPTDILVSVTSREDKAVVSVQDYGIGIPRSQIPKVFDRLYQVTDDKEKTFPGLGMGLYISSQIIKRHRGQIWVESEKDKGSTFYFSLPLN